MGDEVQRFSVASGRFVGWSAVAIAAAVAVLVVLEGGAGTSYEVVALCVFFAALAWAALLRPRVELRSSELVLRNMLSTVTLPLAAIESVVVRQVLVVLAGERRHTCAAVGRSRRQLHRDGRASTGGMMGLSPSALPSQPAGAESATTSYGVFVEERIRARVSDALAREGIAPRSEEQQRRAEDVAKAPAVAEIVVLVGSALAFVLLAAT